jgi:hypothetical protein
VIVRLKFVPKPENKNYNHFTPIKGQASAVLKKQSWQKPPARVGRKQ